MKKQSEKKGIECQNCGASIEERPMDPLYYLYLWIKNRKRPYGKIWVHIRTDDKYCRNTLAEPKHVEPVN